MNSYSSEILLKRLTKYAIDCQKLTIILPRKDFNHIYGNQLIRSSSSPAANYIEAIEASTGKEFIHKLKTCRKETKESIYWFGLVKESNKNIDIARKESERLISEGAELLKIFSSSVITAERNQKINKLKK